MIERAGRAAPALEPAVVLPGPGPGAWVWPWWLRRQLDPASPAWQPADLAGGNRTGRSWTVIGLPDGDDRWLVDRCGLLSPSSGRWALDWWVGAEDRWRLPSSEASLRQRLVDDAPVIETVIRVPGGEIVARHWASPGDDADVVVLEIENASAAPVAVALALRPVGPAGPTGTRRVAVEGSRLTVDGATVLRADVRPRQSVVSDAAGGDVAAIVVANATPAAADARVVCGLGWAGAAVVWPLSHRSTLRVESPGRPAHPRRRPPSGARPPRPGPVETARGWSARTARLTRMELPAGPLASALEAQRRHLLLAVPVGDGEDRTASALVVAALSTAGQRDEAAAHLGRWLDDQHRSGRLGRDEVDTAATLWALETWARIGVDDGLLSRSPLAVGRAAEYLAAPPAPLDPVAATWAVAGVMAAARMLATLGEGAAAARAHEWGRARTEHLLATLAPPGPVPSGMVTAGAPAGWSSTTEAALLAVVLGVVPSRHPVARSARIAARRPVAGFPVGACAGMAPSLGLRPELSLILATSALLGGDDPFDALGWVLSVASSTWTWPTVVAPHLGTGSHGSGHDPRVTAAMWACGRALLVADPPPTGPGGGPARLDILPALPSEWIGRPIEVHGLATGAGPLSCAVRWHGDRPALLWEIAGAGPGPTVTASGLDPEWRGHGWRGEALLGVLAAPGPPTGPPDGPSIA